MDEELKRMRNRPAVTLKLADKIRPHVSGMDWEIARDYIDQYTGNELDCKQLDMLTDWATQRETTAPQNLH